MKSLKGNWFYYGWVVVAVCLVFITVSYGIRFSFGVFFVSLEQEFDLTRALTSGIFSIYMLLGSLFAIIAGWISDRYGAKMVFMTMGFFNFLGLVLTSQTHELWQLFLSFSLLVAMGTGPTYAVATSFATRWFAQRRGFILSLVTSGVGLGSILLAPLAAFLITDYGWRISCIVLGAIALILMASLSLLLRKPPGDGSTVSDGKNEIGTPSLGTRKNEEEFSIRKTIKKKSFLCILAMWFCYSFCLFMVTTHIVPHAIDLGVDPLQAASLISVSGLANIPTRILMGLASDRFGRKPTALICASVMAVSFLWLAFASDLWMLYVFAAVFGAAYGGLSPPVTAIVGDIFGVSHIGLIFGLLEVGWVCGAAAGPAIAGYIFDVSGRYYSAFLLGVVMALILVVLILFLLRGGERGKKTTAPLNQ
jgi:OFA family oxalate/formate antiporter-like MFS transporter